MTSLCQSSYAQKLEMISTSLCATSAVVSGFEVIGGGGGGGGHPPPKTTPPPPTPLHLPPPPGRGKQNNPGLNRVKLKCTECMKNVLHRFQDAPTAKYTPDGRS